MQSPHSPQRHWRCGEIHPGVVRRAKAFHLEGEGEGEGGRWKDLGTGLVQLHQHYHPPPWPTAILPSSFSLPPPHCLCCPSLLLVVWAEGGGSAGGNTAVTAVEGSGTSSGSDGSPSPPPSSPPPLLAHRVSVTVEYVARAETILSWTVEEEGGGGEGGGGGGGDWALSFQDPHRCRDLVEAIAEWKEQWRSVGGHQQPQSCPPPIPLPSDGEVTTAMEEKPLTRPLSPHQPQPGDEGGTEDSPLLLSPSYASFPPVNSFPSNRSPSPSSSLVSSSLSFPSSEGWSAALGVFPPLSSLSSLPVLHQRLVESQTSSSLRQSLVLLTTAPQSPWLPSLFGLCRRCEEAEDLQGLQKLFALLVALINALHEERLLERLFDSETAYATLAVLEYDPAIIATLSSTHSLHLPLRRHAETLRSVRCHRPHLLSLTEEEGSDGRRGAVNSSGEVTGQSEWNAVERCLHFHYRLSYAKDAILLPHLDDAAIATFTSTLHLYKLSIIQQCHEDIPLVHHSTRALQRIIRTADHSRDDRGEGTSRLLHLHPAYEEEGEGGRRRGEGRGRRGRRATPPSSFLFFLRSGSASSAAADGFIAFVEIVAAPPQVCLC